MSGKMASLCGKAAAGKVILCPHLRVSLLGSAKPVVQLHCIFNVGGTPDTVWGPPRKGGLMTTLFLLSECGHAYFFGLVRAMRNESRQA